jgi:hypothetical protein
VDGRGCLYSPAAILGEILMTIVLVNDTIEMLCRCAWGQGYREDGNRPWVPVPSEPTRPAEAVQAWSGMTPTDRGIAGAHALPSREDVESGAAA